MICPFCGNRDAKFYFYFNYESFNCYHCKRQGSLKSFIYLLHSHEIKVSDLESNNFVRTERLTDYKPTKLPIDFMRLNNPTSFMALEYVNYIFNRGIDFKTALYYNFGYSPSMSFQLIMPVQNEIGENVYYTTRVIRDGITKEKAYNPTAKAGCYGRKDVIFGLNRCKGGTVYLFEGVFSALSAQTLNYPAVALLGKSLSDEQLSLLMAYNFKDIVICFDDDATTQSYDLAYKIQHVFNSVHIIEFPKDKDANDLLLEGTLVDKMHQLQPVNRLNRLKGLLKNLKNS